MTVADISLFIEKLDTETEDCTRMRKCQSSSKHNMARRPGDSASASGPGAIQYLTQYRHT